MLYIALKFHLRAESNCSSHCSAFAASSDFDQAVYENCNHNPLVLDFNNQEYCSYIVPDLKKDDSTVCVWCKQINKVTQKVSQKILKCVLNEDCTVWIHEKCLQQSTLCGRTSNVFGCRYDTELYDRHHHQEQCQSCNSIFYFYFYCSKALQFLTSYIFNSTYKHNN